MVDRSLSLGGGRTPVRVFEGDTVGHLKQSIHRQCAIEPTGTHTLLLHKYNLEALEHDDQLLDTIVITDRSSVFVSLQGTLTNQKPSSPLLHPLIGLDWIGLDWIGLDWIGLDWIGLDWIGLDWIGLID